MMIPEGKLNRRAAAADCGGEAGFALVSALFVMLILSILAVASLQTTSDERMAARSVRNSTEAFYAADAGLNAVQAAWATTRYDTLLAGSGDSLILGWQTLEDGGSYRAVLRRVDGGSSATQLFSITTTGRGPGVNRGEQALTLFLTKSVSVGDFARAALQTTVEIEVEDPETILNGTDANPPGWTCDAPGPGKPGLLMQDTTTLELESGTILGNPPLAEDATISSTHFTQFGNVSYAELVAMADKTYSGNGHLGTISPAVAGGQCSTGVQSNWGDPLNPGGPCGGYFPIIHVAGDAEFEDGSVAGQGILLIDGDLEAEAEHGATFNFYGLVVVQGSCEFEHEVTFYGAVLCANSSTDEQELEEGAVINYSQCVLKKALGSAGLGNTHPLAQRAWHQSVN
ncbi:MAG: PilX N-terminal domain-containing pilus assembly protein [Gemmatimonadota bacterium]